MPIDWIEYKNKEILLIDYRGLGEEEIIETLKLVPERIRERPAPVLLLADVTDTTTTPAFMSLLKEVGVQIKPFLDKQAIVGISGLKRILLDAYNRFTGSAGGAFPTLDEAKEWLVK
jgi:hypothetical protein